MVNKEEKKRFIEERYKDYSEETKLNQFSSLVILCEAENFYKKDLSELSVNQLNALLEKLSDTYNKYLRYKRLINEYNKWKNSPNRADLNWTQASQGSDLSSKYVKDFDELYFMVCDSLSMEERSAEPFYALMIFLCWTGLSKDDIVKLEKYGVDYVANQIYVNGNSYLNVDERIINQCGICSDITEYVEAHQRLIDNQYVFRRRYTEGISEDVTILPFTITHAFNRFNESQMTLYTFNTIRKSGLFYECYQLDTEGRLDLTNPHETFNDIASRRFHKKAGLSKGLYHDYQLWKSFFYD